MLGLGAIRLPAVPLGAMFVTLLARLHAKDTIDRLRLGQLRFILLAGHDAAEPQVCQPAIR